MLGDEEVENRNFVIGGLGLLAGFTGYMRSGQEILVEHNKSLEKGVII